MFFLRLAGVFLGRGVSSSSESEVIWALRFAGVLLAGVFLFLVAATVGVFGAVAAPPAMALLVLRILEKCSVKAFLVGGSPKELAGMGQSRS